MNFWCAMGIELNDDLRIPFGIERSEQGDRNVRDFVAKLGSLGFLLEVATLIRSLNSRYSEIEMFFDTLWPHRAEVSQIADSHLGAKICDNESG
jgi:hypothetical protein